MDRVKHLIWNIPQDIYHSFLWGCLLLSYPPLVFHMVEKLLCELWRDKKDELLRNGVGVIDSTLSGRPLKPISLLLGFERMRQKRQCVQMVAIQLRVLHVLFRSFKNCTVLTCTAFNCVHIQLWLTVYKLYNTVTIQNSTSRFLFLSASIVPTNWRKKKNRREKHW